MLPMTQVSVSAVSFSMNHQMKSSEANSSSSLALQAAALQSNKSFMNGHMQGTPMLMTNPASKMTHKLAGGRPDRTSPPTYAYLQELLQEKQNIQKFVLDKKSFPIMPSSHRCSFVHSERFLDEEIVKVRSVLFQNGDKQPLELPTPQGPTVTLTEKVYVPVKEHPEYNFVGRLLGPRGLTAKQLEQETRCKIMVRGKGSMRDKKKEDSNRGKPNWEHLTDDLHVLITVEDTENRARIKMKRAIEEINKLLVPTEGEDELKKKQLMELAIINGTYRDYSTPSNQPRLMAPPPVIQNAAAIRQQQPGQQQLGVLNSHILSRLPNGQHVITNGLPHPPPMLTPGDGSLLYYTPFDYAHSPAIASAPFDYNMLDPSAILGQIGVKQTLRQTAAAISRHHPYHRSPAATN